MSALTDSEDEADQRPSFGNPKTMPYTHNSEDMVKAGVKRPHSPEAMVKAGVKRPYLSEDMVKAGVKRPCSSISAAGDAKTIGGTMLAHTPAEFVKHRGSGPVEVSDAARNMMAKMGHKEGTGLGKHSQGRTQIIEASTQRGRRGLGLTIAGLEPSDVEWDFSKEEIIIDEVVEWLPPYTGSVPSFEEMQTWKVVGPKKREIDDEAHFCSKESLDYLLNGATKTKDLSLLHNFSLLHLKKREIDDEAHFCSKESLDFVLNGKSVFDVLEPEEMRRARTRSNPYETIRGAFFLNRAAMKMANMDAILDFMFTNPKHPTGEPQVGPNELLYFADICAGPGGFSEYVLWRKKGESKGFGLTLRGSNDFKLEDFFAGPPEMFEPHYGVNGLHGDGDIFNPKNQEAFTKFVLDNTDNLGVHFVMADGGFSVEGQENIQEILSKQLYLCQFLVAIAILRPGGHFVCKLFDMFTPFSVGLVYLMNMIFDNTAIFKPVTSRPANSERYIVCKYMKNNKEPVMKYMQALNVDLCYYMSAVCKKDILDIVPLKMMLDDEPFFTYMVNSNEQLAKIQAINLKKIEIFTKNSTLHENRQSEVRRKCLEKWKIPDEVRKAPGRPDPSALFHKLIPNNYQDVFRERGELLTLSTLPKIKCLSSYTCLVRGEGSIFYLLGCGRSNVFKWDGGSNFKWQRLDGNKIELPNQTLLEVQAVFELRGEGKGQHRQMALHVIDAYFLCGEDVRSLSFEKRQQKLQKFVKALRKPTRSDLTQLHCPEVYPLEKVDQIFNRLDMRLVKSNTSKPRLCYTTDSRNFFHPTGMVIIQTVKEPWIRGHSKSTGLDYWYNIHNRKSLYDCPPESIATVSDCKIHSFYWSWVDGVKVHPEQETDAPNLLSKEQFMDHIQKLKQL